MTLIDTLLAPLSNEALVPVVDQLQSMFCNSRSNEEAAEELRTNLATLLTPVVAEWEQAQAATCAWIADDDGIYHTACGEVFIFTDDGPVENKQRFCGYCGKAMQAEPVRPPRPLTPAPPGGTK